MATYNATVDDINKTIQETWIEPNNAKVDRNFQYSGDNQFSQQCHDDFLANDSPTAQEQDFPAGRLLKYYDTQNTHPYNELDVTKGADGKVTAAQVVLDQKSSPPECPSARSSARSLAPRWAATT